MKKYLLVVSYVVAAATVALAQGPSSPKPRAPRPVEMQSSAPRQATRGVTAAANTANPSTLEFPPSSDQDTIENGVTILTAYSVDFATAAAPATVVRNVPLGKLTPVMIGGVPTIQWGGFTAIRTTFPQGTYVAFVRSEGPGGSTVSIASDPFDLKPRNPNAPGKPVWK